MASLEISGVGLTVSVPNAFQQLIALGDFLHAQPKSCWKQFKPFPFGLSLCGEEKSSPPWPLQGPFTESLAPTGTSFAD